jgi:polyphenol oxidase
MPTASWLHPDWPVPAQVRAVCSMRVGGVSQAPFDALNLGDHVGDEPTAVAVNRQRFAQSLGAHAVFLRQVHGWTVAALAGEEGHIPDGQTADASTTTQRGVACTVMVADCLPVLFARADGLQVAAAHAGWRGLLGERGFGVLEMTYQSFRHYPPVNNEKFAINNDIYGTVAADSPLLAWLGPCIGPQAFEVGAEVYQAFVQADAASAVCFVPQGAGKYLCDLAGLARLRLARLGLTQVYGNDSSPRWCTVSNPSRFFSHRRDGGVSGRFAASVWLA